MSEITAGLSAAMLLPERDLLKLIRSAPKRYKVYYIEKKVKGQYREIAQPAKEVKALQYWVIANVLTKFHVHACATGYREGKNISHNAWPHVYSRYLLKLDFKEFFPSIKERDFRRFLKAKAPQVTSTEAEFFIRILFWKPKHAQDRCLAIGAPSSPLLSNVLLFDFDARVANFCDSLGVVYTRYADDLSFSATDAHQLNRVESMVTETCAASESPRLTLNQQKTVRVSKKRSRRITGLVLTNDGLVSLGRDQKRRIRAGVYRFATGKLNEVEQGQLRGMLAYVNSVEPAFLTRLKTKYGVEVIRCIQRVPCLRTSSAVAPKPPM